MKKGPWALKQSFKYAYNINQNRSYMQLLQKTLYNSSQGCPQGFPGAFLLQGLSRELPGASPGQSWRAAYRSTIEPTPGKDLSKPDDRQSESLLVRGQSPDGQQDPRLQRGLERQRALGDQQSTGSHRQALVNNCPNIIPGRRNLVY